MKSKKQSVNFDLPLSDSVRGKSTLDGLIVAIVQMNLVRRRFGGSTKRVKTFVAPMGIMHDRHARSCRARLSSARPVLRSNHA